VRHCARLLREAGLVFLLHPGKPFGNLNLIYLNKTMFISDCFLLPYVVEKLSTTAFCQFIKFSDKWIAAGL
jgi:hypothetical protein